MQGSNDQKLKIKAKQSTIWDTKSAKSKTVSKKLINSILRKYTTPF